MGAQACLRVEGRNTVDFLVPHQQASLSAFGFPSFTTGGERKRTYPENPQVRPNRDDARNGECRSKVLKAEELDPTGAELHRGEGVKVECCLHVARVPEQNMRLVEAL